MPESALNYNSQNTAQPTNMFVMKQFINLLTESANLLTMAIWSQGGEQIASYEHFLQLFQREFDHSPEVK